MPVDKNLSTSEQIKLSVHLLVTGIWIDFLPYLEWVGAVMLKMYDTWTILISSKVIHF